MKTRLIFLVISLCGFLGCSSLETQFKGDRVRSPDSEMQILKDDKGESYDLSASPSIQASISWNGWGGNYSDCTHTWVSNQGHMLTALHCIRSCIEQSKFERFKNEQGFEQYKLIKNEKGEEGYVETGLLRKIKVPNTVDSYGVDPYVVYEVDEEKLKNVVCLDGQAKGLQMRILALGAKGWIPEYDIPGFSKAYSEIYQEYRKKGFVGIQDIGDFALVQVEKIPDTSVQNGNKFFSYPPNCLKMRKDQVKTGEKVWNLSYPAFTRKDGSESSYDPRVSGGVVFSKWKHPRYSPENLKVLDDRFLYASTDIEGGSSGSSLLDEKGDIAGVISLKTEGPNQYVMGSTAFIPSPIILERFREKLGADFVKTQLLDGCQVNSKTESLLKHIRETISTEN